MKVNFVLSHLQKGFSTLNHVISTRNQLPILSYVLMDVIDGKVVLSATDLEIGIKLTIPAQIIEEGSVTIPAKLFSELISNLNEEKITLQATELILEVIGENTKTTIQTLPKNDFPLLYDERGEEIFTLKPLEIKKNLTSVLFAGAIDTTRPVLSGVLIKKVEQSLFFVATDGYRLSLYTEVFSNSNLAKDFTQHQFGVGFTSIIVPTRVIKEVFSFSENEEIKVYVSSGNNQIIFYSDTLEIIGRLIEGDFPQYEKIIPTDHSTTMEFNRQDLLKAVKICAIFARQSTNIIKLAFKKDQVTISANAESVGDNVVNIQGKLIGEENEIAFNARYLLEILGAVSEDDMVFEMIGPLNSGVFKIKDNSSFLHLIMPVRVQE